MTAAMVLKALQKQASDNLSKEEAQERLKNIGILDQNNRVVEEYRELIVSKKAEHE